MIDLSPGQAAVFDKIMAWHTRGGQRFVLAGYAGTGKTTLAKYIAEAVGEDGVIFCAFTGKAANVLKEKNCANAGTIHKYLYSLSSHQRERLKALEAEIWRAREDGNGARADMLAEELAELRIKFRKPTFELNTESAVKNARLVIVDEYSMLNDKIIGDLESLAKKVLYIGDPFQLPPVSGECSLQPEEFLTEIHRQAMDSSIIRHSKTIREGGSIHFCIESDFHFVPRRSTQGITYMDADQLIVGRNKTRTEWNKRYRRNLGFDSPLPTAGDKMICLKNNQEAGVFNGMIGRCTQHTHASGDEAYIMTFDEIEGLKVWQGDVMGYGEKYDGYNDSHRKLERFDFGYSITAHKSQGSEFDKVVVYNEPIGRGIERRRWLYTAITRGKKFVTLVEP